MRIPEQFISAIHSAQRVALFTHIHPDGDALGSLLGFSDILKALGKQVFCYLEEPLPSLYEFLPGSESISCSFASLQEFCKDRGDLVGISLDCGDCDRLGSNQDYILTIEPFLVVDHHRTHRDFGALRWVDPERSSTGEMIYELAEMFGVSLNKSVATNLYVAIVTDTGSFRYECTSSHTMRIGAELVDHGVCPDEISEHLHNNSSYARIKLMALVLSSLTMYGDGRIALIRLNPEMLEESGATLEDVEGFVDIPRSIRSTKAAVFLKEGQAGIISVSLRAKGECDVSLVANTFGGGGHRNASGCRFSGKSIQEVERLIIEELTHHLPQKR